MPSRGTLKLATAVLLLEILSLAAAHSDEHNGEKMDISPNENANMQSQGDALPGSYWRLSEHAALMYWHIGLEVLSWVVVLPIAVMLSIASSRTALYAQFTFLSTNALALVFGLVYNHRTPELYAADSHSKMGWAFTWVAFAWFFMALIQAYAGRASAHPEEASQPMTTANMARYQCVQDEDFQNPSRWSNDSGQGTERNSASLFGHSRSPSVESGDQQFTGPPRRYTQDDLDLSEDASEKHGFLRNNTVDRFFSRNVARFAVGRTSRVIRILYIVIERTILVQGLFAIASGTIVYGGIGRGGAVFNVLAHYVKGGIFFLYGLLTLGRWMGAFADFGWAWNIKPSSVVVARRRAALPSAEFTESFVIWLYGVTNVFLEHMAAWGDAWTAQDMEHVSISVMFFGGGLLGMIIESRWMRRMLNSAIDSSQYNTGAEAWQEPRQYGVSMNPLPALIIMLLGKMMSSHHQASMLSSMIHGQWGTMFMGFALARGLTYIIIYVSPPTSYLPSRPPTEIVSAFCLIAGGITFMLSNKDTVAALEGYKLDAMFTFTVTMGTTALIMAWTTVVLAIKGWAVRRGSRSERAKSFAGALA